MAKTSIHIQPIRSGSEVHNRRTKELDYVRKDLTPLNESLSVSSVDERLEAVRKRYEETTGQKMQKKATPIREGVVVIDKKTTIEDLKKFSYRLEERFGIKTFQIHMHKDEGHMNAKKWTPNLHAHMVFDWTDQNGKSLKLNKQDMAEMQTILAESLGMERGESSDVKHLNAVQFKVKKEREREMAISSRLKHLDKILGKMDKNIFGNVKIRPIIENYDRFVERSEAEKKKLVETVEGLKAENYTVKRNRDHISDELHKSDKQLKQLKESREKGLRQLLSDINGYHEANGIDVRYHLTRKGVVTPCSAEEFKKINRGQSQGGGLSV